MSILANAEPCYSDIDQDLNCNGLDVSDEPPVDLNDPICSSTTDSNGVPYPNADYYYDYNSFGCRYPVSGNDADGDGLSAGQIYLTDDNGQILLVAALLCDNCPDGFNPDQLDTDCDGFGDICDNCLESYNPYQLGVTATSLGTIATTAGKSTTPNNRTSMEMAMETS